MNQNNNFGNNQGGNRSSNQRNGDSRGGYRQNVRQGRQHFGPDNSGSRDPRSFTKGNSSQNYNRPPSYIYPHSQYSGTGVRSSRWIPLFASLLLLMITMGIFFTVINSVRKQGSDVDVAQTDVDYSSETDYVDTEDVQGDITGKINVSYAIKSKDTRTLTSEIVSDYAIMIDVKENLIVAQKNPDVMIFPASMTKIMTLIVAYENCKNFDDTFVLTAEITDPLFQAGASVAGFKTGVEISITDLLYGAILPSGADATDALAIYTAGSIEAFVEMMNRKAIMMGLSNTHFSNPSGLHDDNHYSTPHEMALILEYALQIEGCREILSTYTYTTQYKDPETAQSITLVSTMFSRMEGGESGVARVIAGKTGYTNEGLNCLASMAQTNDGKEYILVTAHAAGKYDPVYDCINLYKLLF